MARNIQQLFDLSGRIALVGDGASGYGLQIAHALGEAGARVMLAAPDADALEQAVAELQSAGIDARWVAADLTRGADIAYLVSETLQRMGDIEILVNADVRSPGAAWRATADAAQAQPQPIPTDASRFVQLSQIVVRLSMARQRRGRIVHVAAASTAGERDALMGVTQRQAIAWAPSAITVNGIFAGGLPGAGGAATLAALGADRLDAHLALPQPDADDDLKGASLLFAADAGRCITGQWLALDGGASLRPDND